MRKVLVLMALMALTAQADAQFGKRPINVPFNTKEIQIGFRANFVVNTSYVNRNASLWLVWGEVGTKYVLRFGVPRKPLTDDWGQTPIKDYSDEQFNWCQIIETDEPNYLFNTHYFDYVVQVFAYDDGGNLVKSSQIRYVRQK